VRCGIKCVAVQPQSDLLRTSRKIQLCACKQKSQAPPRDPSRPETGPRSFQLRQKVGDVDESGLVSGAGSSAVQGGISFVLILFGGTWIRRLVGVFLLRHRGPLHRSPTLGDSFRCWLLGPRRYPFALRPHQSRNYTYQESSLMRWLRSQGCSHTHTSMRCNFQNNTRSCSTGHNHWQKMIGGNSSCSYQS
jgi:hypothetical protein